MATGHSIMGSLAKSSTLKPGAILKDLSASSGESGAGGGSLNLSSTDSGPAFFGWIAHVDAATASVRSDTERMRGCFINGSGELEGGCDGNNPEKTIK
jgi:hypothetical protein